MDSPSFSKLERTGDEVSADRYRLIADKIEADPSLLDIPLANIARWLANGHTAVQRLEGWRSMILDAKASREGMEKLRKVQTAQGRELPPAIDFGLTPNQPAAPAPGQPSNRRKYNPATGQIE
jgi:hypothetical protein